MARARRQQEERRQTGHESRKCDGCLRENVAIQRWESLHLHGPKLASRSVQENTERNFREKLLNPLSQDRVFPPQKQSSKVMSKNTVGLRHGQLNKEPSCGAPRPTEPRPAGGEVNCGCTPLPRRGGPGLQNHTVPMLVRPWV